jgi:hypothetical protein
VSNQGNRDRDRENDIGQPGKDGVNPAGTSGRNEGWQKENTDPNPPAGRKPIRGDEDEDSPLGNRTGFR